MFSVQQGLEVNGVAVPSATLCQWFGVARRTMHYMQTRPPAR